MTGTRVSGKSLGQRSRPSGRGTWRVLAVLLAAAAASSGAATPARAQPEPVRFAVLGDPHFYDGRLGVGGAAFEAYQAQDPKLLAESGAILDAALEGIVSGGAQFVLVVGDLTKDGELSSHVRVAQRFHELEKKGIQVFVVPGNHDIRNPDAVGYRGDGTYPVPDVSPATFRALYERFGYDEALERDTHSLSYLAEPVRDLWLLALDSNKYTENEPGQPPIVSGRLAPETLAWAVAKIREGRAAGKAVIAMMHHGVNPDFLPQPVLFADYLVDDWPTVSTELAAAGLQVVFTGHYHSQDASFAPEEFPIRSLCDVETSSLATFPNAYRLASLDAGGLLSIESRRVTEIDFDTGGVPFPEYSETFLRARLPAIITARLMADFALTEAQAAQLAPLVVNAIVAQYDGDEQPDPSTQEILDGMVASPEPTHSLGLLLWGIWTDLAPADNELQLPLP